MEFKDYTTELVEKEGIFYSREKATISYPENGNDICYQIEDISFWFNHRNDCIKDVVKKYNGKRFFFDIGGGNGFVAKGLEDAGIPTALLDPGVKGCINAKNRNLKHIICSTLEDARFRASSIESIGLFDVVEHIEDDHAFLKNIQQILQPGGMVFLTVPAYSFLWSVEDVDAGHYRRYSLSQIENKLKEIGFTLVYSTYIFSLLPIPVFLFRTLPSKLGFYKKPAELNELKSSHNIRNGLLSKIIDKLWSCELKWIQKNRKIPFGGSCLVVAKKL